MNPLEQRLHCLTLMGGGDITQGSTICSYVTWQTVE